MVVENVTAVLKDIKVTKKGINLSLEGVKLQGEQLQNLASLIGEVIVFGVDIPQMSIFDDADVNEMEDTQDDASEEQAELFEGESVEGEDAENVDNGEVADDFTANLVDSNGEEVALEETSDLSPASLSNDDVLNELGL